MNQSSNDSSKLMRCCWMKQNLQKVIFKYFYKLGVDTGQDRENFAANLRSSSWFSATTLISRRIAAKFLVVVKEMHQLHRSPAAQFYFDHTHLSCGTKFLDTQVSLAPTPFSLYYLKSVRSVNWAEAVWCEVCLLSFASLFNTIWMQLNHEF